MVLMLKMYVKVTGDVDVYMISDFKKFLLRGNVVDLAVAVVVGSAFGAVVSSLVRDFITPLIAAIGGKPNFNNLHFVVNNSKFMYGDFVNAVLSFFVIALVVFFLVIVPINRLIAFSRRSKEAVPDKKTCPECLSEIPKAAIRCAFCTAKLQP